MVRSATQIRILGALAAGVLMTIALSQGGTQKSTKKPDGAAPAKPVIDLTSSKYGTLILETKLGSFKLLPKFESAEGRIDLNFTGTVLLAKFNGTVEKSGNLKLEYKGMDREVYFGTGRIVATGKFRAVQWFGRDLKGKFTGDGAVRLYGEFDQNLETGWYWYEDEQRKQPWGTYGSLIEIPRRQYYGTGTPVPRKKKPNP
jgi:hypothetical protein